MITYLIGNYSCRDTEIKQESQNTTDTFRGVCCSLSGAPQNLVLQAVEDVKAPDRSFHQVMKTDFIHCLSTWPPHQPLTSGTAPCAVQPHLVQIPSCTLLSSLSIYVLSGSAAPSAECRHTACAWRNCAGMCAP